MVAPRSRIRGFDPSANKAFFDEICLGKSQLELDREKAALNRAAKVLKISLTRNSIETNNQILYREYSINS